MVRSEVLQFHIIFYNYFSQTQKILFYYLFRIAYKKVKTRSDLVNKKVHFNLKIMSIDTDMECITSFYVLSRVKPGIHNIKTNKLYFHLHL